MPINQSYGYPGSVNAAALSKWLPMVSAARYSVADAGDFRVTGRTGADRGISIAPGTIAGDGIMDVMTAADTSVVLPAVSGASTVIQWFLVVLRRNWSTKTSTFAIIPGNDQPFLPFRSLWKNKPGEESDQPLALVAVSGGSATIGQVRDLRVWGRNGGLVAVDDLVRTYLEEPGSTVRIGPYLWERTITKDLAKTWIRTTPGGSIGYTQAGYKEPSGSGGLIASISIPDPGFPYHVATSAVVEAGGGGSGTRWDVDLAVGNQGIASSRGDAVAPWFTVSGNTNRPISGASAVTLSARRMFGNGAFGVSSFNQFFTALVVPAL